MVCRNWLYLLLVIEVAIKHQQDLTLFDYRIIIIIIIIESNWKQKKKQMAVSISNMATTLGFP